MKIFRALLMLFILMILATPSYANESPDAGWTPVGEGIDYQMFVLPDPNNVFVARMDRSNPNVILESSIPHGGLSGSLETVRSMAASAEQAINYWGGSFSPATWGARNDVVVAINGSYFDFDTKIMAGGIIHSGWYAKRFDDCGGYTGFGWGLDREAFIGENVWHRPEKNIVVFPATEETMQFDNVNGPRHLDELVMYTPQYAETTLTNNKGVEVLVELARPTMLLPAPNVYAKGYVRDIWVKDGNNVIPFDHVVLSASGALSETLLANVSMGAEVHISQELTSGLAGNCYAPMDLDWTKTYAIVQGHYYFLKNGVINPYGDDENATDLEPRTAIAYNDQYIFFIVVDGRDALHSIGMTIEDLAEFTLNTLGATYAVAQDGGGSSTMVINGEVKNNVYCNNVFCLNPANYFSYLPVTARKVTPQLLSDHSRSQINAYTETYERWVANGMMMVEVEQPIFSDTFEVAQNVALSKAALVFTGPGTNFHTLVEMPAGETGVIIDALSELNGVWARDAYWWRVDFGDYTGWVREDSLVAR